ncbi:CDP-glycerol glycerophosphotransferase family protein [Actinomycetes bacterium NPDC127524]
MKMKLFRFLKRSKNKIRLKHKLSVSQENGTIFIQGAFSKEFYCAKELWVKVRETGEMHQAAEIKPNPSFAFGISLDELLSHLSEEEQAALDLFIKVSVRVDSLEKELDQDAAEIAVRDGVEYAEYLIRLGRFQHTSIKYPAPYRTDDNKTVHLFVTKKGNVSILLNQEPAPSIRSQIEKISYEQNKMIVEGRVFSRNSRITHGEAFIKGRKTNLELYGQARFTLDDEGTAKKYGLNRYTYRVELDMEKLHDARPAEDDIYDYYFDLNLHDQLEVKRARIGRPTGRVKLFLKETFLRKGSEAYVINPYFTFKAKNLSIEVYGFPVDTFNYLRKMRRFAPLYRMFNKSKEVWLIGERSYKAQDTGYHFFKYVRENYPDKKAYYVIEKESPEAGNVEPLGNVLYFKSKEHIKNTVIASKVISSHHPDYLYPVRTRKFKRNVKALKIFLQHGVMGTKNMLANYGKKASGFDTDLFLVSSEFEKDMIISDFGYDEDQVYVTGLSRFDSLFKEDVEIKRQLLIIPTWRDWITSDEVFIESEYFERYRDLIHHPKLHAMAKERNLEIVFCLHPNMQNFTSYFKDAPVRVISQGEVDVQHLIKESAMMITDYSSVAFDFSFLHKPVLYYQFDRDRFIGKRRSHLDLDNDLPGYITDNLEDLLNEADVYSSQDFVMPELYKARANKFIKHRDQHSSERIYEVAEHAVLQRSFFQKVAQTEYYQLFFRQFRKSKRYFPTMKLLYKIMMKTVKVDKNLILFESGVGKQYGDSPRNIYEEMLERKIDMKKVWVYGGMMPVRDRNTKKISRLSPQYYYYLAKAGYWVNNQNFPTYLDKRKETTYIQTWHGTPLKKMLFDIENIQGRDEGYLERVYHATQTWDYLVSPSPYASDAFRSAFRYDGEILETGYPRNDLFFKDDREARARSVAERLNIPEGKKVILYAPTFRDNQTSNKNKFVFDLQFDLERMKQALGDEYVLLLRMHVVISNSLKIPEEYRDFVMNVSKYPDIQELYLISDILMTDYSSVMFDFANTGRPILYYTYDIEDYRDNIRGFYIDFENEAPGPFMKTTEDIIEAVTNIEETTKAYSSKYHAFRQKYCGLEDGKATARIVDRFFGN